MGTNRSAANGQAARDSSTRICQSCPGRSSRRDFVVQGTASLAAVFAGLGATGADLAALRVRFASGRPASGELTYPIPATDGVTVDRGAEVIVVRWQSRLFAFALSCPHQRSMLKWRDSEQRFQCTKHKSRYRPDGVFVSGRATRGMDRYPIRLEGDAVFVDARAAIRQDENEPAWSRALVLLG